MDLEANEKPITYRVRRTQKEPFLHPTARMVPSLLNAQDLAG